jgi:peptide-methionine (R)-S-oxide reductase
MEKIVKSEEQWREDLAPDAYAVLRHAATEPPFTGKYTFEKATGMYKCAGCGADVFASDSKFDSGCGWPSFTESAHPESVELRSDTSHGMVRTEVVCSRCGGHLGHVFDDGPVEAGGQRYCINSVALELEPEDG